MPAWLLTIVFNRYFLAGAAALAIVGAGWWWHTSRVDRAVEAEGKRWEQMVEAERAANRAKISDWVVEMVERDGRARAAYAKLAAERREIFITLQKEVPVYVTSLADSRCIVPRGFVQHHDAAAAAGPAPDPASSGGSVDADSGLALSAVAGTVAVNYAICHDAIAEVRRWREWYADFSAQWEKLRAKFKENP